MDSLQKALFPRWLTTSAETTHFVFALARLEVLTGILRYRAMTNLIRTSPELLSISNKSELHKYLHPSVSGSTTSLSTEKDYLTRFESLLEFNLLNLPSSGYEYKSDKRKAEDKTTMNIISTRKDNVPLWDLYSFYCQYLNSHEYVTFKANNTADNNSNDSKSQTQSIMFNIPILYIPLFASMVDSEYSKSGYKDGFCQKRREITDSIRKFIKNNTEYSTHKSGLSDEELIWLNFAEFYTKCNISVIQFMINPLYSESSQNADSNNTDTLSYPVLTEGIRGDFTKEFPYILSKYIQKIFNINHLMNSSEISQYTQNNLLAFWDQSKYFLQKVYNTFGIDIILEIYHDFIIDIAYYSSLGYSRDRMLVYFENEYNTNFPKLMNALSAFTEQYNNSVLTSFRELQTTRFDCIGEIRKIITELLELPYCNPSLRSLCESFSKG